MPVDRYCTKDGCPGGDGCTNKWRTPGKSCTMEYVAADYEEKFRWKGEGSPPRRWTAPDGTIVYRSYSDYCD
jgi:hypothetical protein